MHKRSVEILRLIQAKEHDKFVQYFSDRYMPNDTLISSLVMLVLHVARGSHREATHIGLKTKDTELGSRMVLSCSEIMSEYLGKNGNGESVTKALRIFCRNKALLDSAEDQPREAENAFMYWFGMDEVFDARQMESLRTGIRLA